MLNRNKEREENNRLRDWRRENQKEVKGCYYNPSIYYTK
jgi:hypothetical protein